MRFKVFSAGLVLAAATFALNGSTLVLAQPGGGGGGFGRMMGGGGGGMMLLMNEKVREELEIVDDQFEELQSMQEDMRDEMTEMFQGMRGGDGGGGRPDMEEMRTKMEERMKVYQEKLDSILLPHQQQRLKQLTLQSQSRGRAAGALLDNDELKDELGITAEQEDKMREAAEKAQEELREQILKLTREAENKIIGVLDSEQQKKYREMVGEPFDFGQQGGRGGPGGPGGQGGGRGGRGGGNRSDF